MPKFESNHDYYADLDLTPDADDAAIRMQYRKLMLQNHPDRHPGRENEFIDTFQSIQAACKVLSDPELRTRYDAARHVNHNQDNSADSRGMSLTAAPQRVRLPPLGPKRALRDPQNTLLQRHVSSQSTGKRQDGGVYEPQWHNLQQEDAQPPNPPVRKPKDRARRPKKQRDPLPKPYSKFALDLYLDVHPEVWDDGQGLPITPEALDGNPVWPNTSFSTRDRVSIPTQQPSVPSFGAKPLSRLDSDVPSHTSLGDSSSLSSPTPLQESPELRQGLTKGHDNAGLYAARSANKAPLEIPPRFPCWCRALCSWQGERVKDLTFVEGDLIEALNSGDGSWWTGRLHRDPKALGWFQSTFVEVLEETFDSASEVREASPAKAKTKEPKNAASASVWHGAISESRRELPWDTANLAHSVAYAVAYEYLCHIGEARAWLQDVLGPTVVAPIEQLEEALRDGVRLAEAAVRLSRSLPTDKQQSITSRPGIFRSPKLQFRHSDNIALFFRFLETVELPEAFRFELLDLYEKRNMPKVIYCIHALAWFLYRKRITFFKLRNLVGELHFEKHELEEGHKSIDRSGYPMPRFSGLRRALREEQLKPQLKPEPTIEELLVDRTDTVVNIQSQMRGALVRLRRGDMMQKLCDAEEQIERLQAIARGGFERAGFATMLVADLYVSRSQAAAKASMFPKQDDHGRRERISTEEAVTRLQSRWRGRRQRANFMARKELLVQDSRRLSTDEAEVTASQTYPGLTRLAEEPTPVIEDLEREQAAQASISDGEQEALYFSEELPSRSLGIAERDAVESRVTSIAEQGTFIRSIPAPQMAGFTSTAAAGFARPLNESETSAFDRFEGHARECLSCYGPQDSNEVGGPLCDWGLRLGRDVAALAYEQDGEVYSTEKDDSNGLVRLELPAGYDQVYALLRSNKRQPQGAQGARTSKTFRLPSIKNSSNVVDNNTSNREIALLHPVDGMHDAADLASVSTTSVLGPSTVDDTDGNRAGRTTTPISNANPARNPSPSDFPRGISPSSSEMFQWAFGNKDGTWTCAYPGCSSPETFSRVRDLLKHRSSHMSSSTMSPPARASPELASDDACFRSSTSNACIRPSLALIVYELTIRPWLRLMRPGVRKGCQRLEWDCSCGRSMYGDYAEHESNARSSLVRSLPNCVVLPPGNRLSPASIQHSPPPVS